MKRKTEKIKLTPWVSWTSEGGLRAASLGAGGEICVLWANGEPAEFTGGVPGGKTGHVVEYQAVIVREDRVDRIPIGNQKWDFHFIEFLNECELLLASSRSVFYEGGKEERNGRVFNPNGQLLRSFCLGDGINHLSATGDGVIWAGYFDEGVFGNNHWEPPIGEKGLIGWDAEGNMREWYEQPDEHFISDCYAMNVAGDGEVWFYFYTDFHIGIRKNGETVYRIPDIEGVSVFAVYKDWVLFSEGYGGRGLYYLSKRNGDRYRTQQELILTDSQGKRINAPVVYARGSKLLLQTETESYVFDLGEWIETSQK